jgi:maltoporin
MFERGEIMATTRKRKSKHKPVWERAYKGHVLWAGKTKLGKVSLQDKGRYFWEAAGKGGSAENLDQAKKAVEYAVLMADKQPDLFNG